MTNNQHGESEVRMIQECVDSYDAKTHSDGKVTIKIEVPKRFADLWLMKLSELRATEAEIREYESPPK